MTRRRLLLIIGLPLYAALLSVILMGIAYCVASNPGYGLEEAWHTFTHPEDWELDEWAWWVYCGIPAMVMALTQGIFLWPVVTDKPMRTTSGKPLMRTVIMAGLIAAVLTTSLILFVFVDLPVVLMEAWELDEDWNGWLALLLLPVNWIIWSIALWIFARRRQSDGRLGRLVGVLLGATVVEMLVVLPIDLMVRRKHDCYCATGSFYGMLLSSWALLWLTGPGIVIAIISRRRRWWSETHCVKCGYEKGPSPGDQCPECGHQWQIAPVETD